MIGRFKRFSKSQQQKRREAFAKLIERHDQEPDDYDEDVEEDPRPYLSGAKEIARYVCVTIHEQKFFFLPTFDDRYEAQARAVEYVHDDIWNEFPVEVFDLDTGTFFRPAWSTISWTMTTPAPEAS